MDASFGMLQNFESQLPYILHRKGHCHLLTSFLRKLTYRRNTSPVWSSTPAQNTTVFIIWCPKSKRNAYKQSRVPLSSKRDQKMSAAQTVKLFVTCYLLQHVATPHFFIGSCSVTKHTCKFKSCIVHTLVHTHTLIIHQAAATWTWFSSPVIIQLWLSPLFDLYAQIRKSSSVFFSH